MRPPSRRVAWIGAATLVVVTAGVLLLRNGGSAVSASERADIRSIGLLPFSFDGDSTYSGIADGLSDGVSTGLVQVAGLGIKSGGRVERYRNRDDDPQTVGRELDVGTVLSAKVRFAANHFRVTARLTDVSTGRLLWQREFNGELVIAGQLQDLWSIQDSLTASIVGAVRPELNTAALPRGIRTRDPTSYQLWLKARKLPPTRTGTDSAIALLRQALRRDSTYADAWAELAAWHFWQYTASYAPAAEVALSWRQAIERAFDSDPRNGPALGSRGQLRILYDWDIEGGLSDLRRAVELNPSWTDLTFTYAIYLALAAQHDSALVYARRAVALDTTSAFAWNILGKVFALAGQRDSAIRASEKSLALDSTLYHTNWVLMNSYLDAGRRSDADRAAALMLRHAEDRPEALSFAATYYRRSGNRIEAREMLNRLTARSRREYVQPAALGAVKLAVGDSSGALDALEQAARERDLHLIDNLVLNYGPLRDEPRFLAIRRRVFRDKLPADFPFP